MIGRSILTGIVLGVLSVGAASALADSDSSRHQHNGYRSWQGSGFGFAPFYAAGASTGPQQAAPQQPLVYDISPAAGQAAFANAEFDNRWADLQVLVDRARKDFHITAEYLSARNALDQAQRDYESAVDTVLARLQSDTQYKDLVKKRTWEQVALKSTGVGTGLRNVIAEEKMHIGSMVTQFEAMALANDPTVQDARARLISADETLRLKEKQFESQLYNRPEVVAARQQMQSARANKAGADGYLRGAFITRADQLNLNDQSNSGNNVYLSGFDSYSRGYYGLGSF